MLIFRRTLSILLIAAFAGCSTSGAGDPTSFVAQPLSCGTAPLAIHQGTNTLLLEGDALSIRAFAPYFSSNTPPVFSFDFKIAGSSGVPHPFDIASDSSGRLYAAIFDDIVHGVAIYDHVPSCTNANVTPDAILAGPHTQLTRTYSLAIDKTGKLYVANVLDDGESEIAIFAAGSTGDTAPIATIRGPHTLLGGQTGGERGFTDSVRVDSNFNVYTANSIGQIAIFAAGSTGDATPSRVIAGSNTGLSIDPTLGLGADGSVYAANFTDASVTVYAPGADGNVAPTRTIKGSQTRIELPRAVAVCSDGTFYVASLRGVLTFYPNSNGDAQPGAIALGGQSGVFQPIALGF